MWNAMQYKSLVSAVLISVTMQGALLWRFNQLATEGTASQAQMASGSEQAAPALREVTLQPVVIVGRREAAPIEVDRVLASTQPPEPEARSEHTQHDIHM